jgi:translation initiation factor 2B subunit (eIF-2B alpha/beta/delta family)
LGQWQPLVCEAQSHIGISVSFLAEARPLCASMGNAIKALKHYITHELEPTLPEVQVHV